MPKAAPKPTLNLDQWADGHAPDAKVTSGSQKDQWQNGNLGASQAHYAEGDSVPYRTVYSSLTEGTTYWTTIQYDTTQQGKHALDYLTTWDRSFPAARNETSPDPLLATSGLLTNTTSTLAIPLDPKVQAGQDGILGTGDDITQVPGQFTFYGGATNLSYVLAGADKNIGTGDDLVYQPGADGLWGTGDERIVTWGADHKWGTGDDVLSVPPRRTSRDRPSIR
jgi:hypothetical protein